MKADFNNLHIEIWIKLHGNEEQLTQHKAIVKNFSKIVFQTEEIALNLTDMILASGNLMNKNQGYIIPDHCVLKPDRSLQN